MTISPQFEKDITTQSYQKEPAIAGVEMIPLRVSCDDGGNFMEVFRMENGRVAGLQEEFMAKQVSMAVILPGVVKAYHLHSQQDDLWFVPPAHRLVANLHDLREDSPTFDLHQRVVLGGGNGSVLRIPHGVAHGAKNCYSKPAFLFYATSEQFNIEAPDEKRLPWDYFGADVWELIKG